jgi:hypothetical protein
MIIGDPGWIRTSDLQLRRLLLYPLSYGAVVASSFYAAATLFKSCPMQHINPSWLSLASACE